MHCSYNSSFNLSLQAEAVVALAGSDGRSWCTTYSPRPTASTPDSASEGSLMCLEKNKDKAVKSGGGKLDLSSDVQTLLRGLA